MARKTNGLFAAKKMMKKRNTYKIKKVDLLKKMKYDPLENSDSLEKASKLVAERGSYRACDIDAQGSVCAFGRP